MDNKERITKAMHFYGSWRETADQLIKTEDLVATQSRVLQNFATIVTKQQYEVKRLRSLCAQYAEALELAAQSLSNRVCSNYDSKKCRWYNLPCDQCRREYFLEVAQNA